MATAGKMLWCWSKDSPAWEPYTEEQAIILEAAYAQFQEGITEHADLGTWRVDFTSMTQYVADEPHRQRPVKRVDTATVCAAGAMSAFPVELGKVGKDVGFNEIGWQSMIARQSAIENGQDVETLVPQHSKPADMHLEAYTYNGPGEPTADILGWKGEAQDLKTSLREETETGKARIEGNKAAVCGEDQAPYQRALKDKRTAGIDAVAAAKTQLERVTDKDADIGSIVGEVAARRMTQQEKRLAKEDARATGISDRFGSVLDQKAQLLGGVPWRLKLDTLVADERWPASLGESRVHAQELKDQTEARLMTAEAAERDVKDKLDKCKQQKKTVNGEESNMRIELKRKLDELMKLVRQSDDKRVEHKCLMSLCEKLETDSDNTRAEVMFAQTARTEAYAMFAALAKEADDCEREGQQCFKDAATAAAAHIWPTAVVEARNTLLLKHWLSRASDDEEAQLASLQAKKTREEKARKKDEDDMELDEADREWKVQERNGAIAVLETAIAEGRVVMARLGEATGAAEQHFDKLKELDKYQQAFQQDKLDSEESTEAKNSFGEFPKLFSLGVSVPTAVVPPAVVAGGAFSSTDAAGSTAIQPEIVTEEMQLLRNNYKKMEQENEIVKSNLAVVTIQYKKMQEQINQLKASMAAGSTMSWEDISQRDLEEELGGAVGEEEAP